MKIQPYSATILGGYSVILIGIGMYFIFLRPTLLPEDAVYAGASLKELLSVAPNLGQWLNKVFVVLGGYILTTGILTLHLASTSFRARAPGSGLTVALSGITSIGIMVVVNLVIDSDFKWPLVAVSMTLVLAIVLYARGK